MTADFFVELLRPVDLILLCSDGLSNMVSETDMGLCLDQNISLQQKARQLVDMANEHGGKDNITAVMVEPQISEVTPC